MIIFMIFVENSWMMTFIDNLISLMTDSVTFEVTVIFSAIAMYEIKILVNQVV